MHPVLLLHKSKINHVTFGYQTLCNPKVANSYSPYPSGFFCCQFQRSLHMVSRSCDALNPSSASATAGSAVRSGTSPRLGTSRQRSSSKSRRQCLPSPNNFVLVIEPRRFSHGLNYLQHAHPFPLSKVVRLVSRGVRTVVEHLGIRSKGF